jgi:peptidylprolyl isomerase
MKRLWIGLCAATLAMTPVMAQESVKEELLERCEPPAEISVERLSEMLGHLVGSNLKGPGFALDAEAIIRGVRSGVAGGEAPMSLEEYQQGLIQLHSLAFETQATENLREAEAFLAANRLHDGIVELEPGRLQYCIVQEGNGPAVQTGATPLIHYTGRYPDGSVFGTSTEGEPVTMALEHAIPGFAQGVVGMKEGEKRLVFLHPDLGYGTAGELAPNSALVFEIEVLKAETRVSDPS